MHLFVLKLFCLMSREQMWLPSFILYISLLLTVVHYYSSPSNVPIVKFHFVVGIEFLLLVLGETPEVIAINWKTWSKAGANFGEGDVLSWWDCIYSHSYSKLRKHCTSFPGELQIKYCWANFTFSIYKWVPCLAGCCKKLCWSLSMVPRNNESAICVCKVKMAVVFKPCWGSLYYLIPL